MIGKREIGKLQFRNFPIPKFQNFSMTNFVCKKFDELNPHELYAILQMRNEVFVVEQNCVYQDADNKDQPAYHMMAWKDGMLAGYTRLIPAGVAYEQPSIGRVITSPKWRGTGI